MSVYTVIERDELIAFLHDYAAGELVDFQGISAGIENTNYFVTTTGGRFVLTIFETHSAEELTYFLDLMAFLAEHQVPSAHPVADKHNRYLCELKGKPAALVQRLEGASIIEPTIHQCAVLGGALGHLHAEGQSFAHHRKNERGPKWWRDTVQRLLPHLAAEELEMLQEELRFQALHRFDDLPRGVIHADLFRDNVLWNGEQLTGMIDFYYACDGPLLYDVAVTANDWCCETGGELDDGRLAALLSGYMQERPFQPAEKEAWPVMLRAAALRFWLSRLQDLHFPRPGEITHTKDPGVFGAILKQRIERHDRLHASLP